MDIMDTARLNIKKRREQKGLRQQDMAEKLNMTVVVTKIWKVVLRGWI
jgi:transcriptional regulator with XRE-family HTH domain